MQGSAIKRYNLSQSLKEDIRLLACVRACVCVCVPIYKFRMGGMNGEEAAETSLAVFATMSLPKT